MNEIRIPNTGTSYDGHDFEEYDPPFEDLQGLALYMLSPENDSPGFREFRAFVGNEMTTQQEWRSLSCALIADLDVPAIPIFVFGLQVLCAVADQLR